jgi:hypothetical protein
MSSGAIVMRYVAIGVLSAALAAGAVGCGRSASDAASEAPLVATGNELLVTLKLSNMT